MSCTHTETAWYRAPGGAAECFDCRRVRVDAERQAARVELARLLSGGVTLREHHGGGATDWLVSPAGYIVSLSIAPDGSSSTPVVHMCWKTDAAGLAAHLENRSYGFGFVLEAQCFHCGAERVPFASVEPDNDPTCDACKAKLAEVLQLGAELRALNAERNELLKMT